MKNLDLYLNRSKKSDKEMKEGEKERYISYCTKKITKKKKIKEKRSSLRV